MHAASELPVPNRYDPVHAARWDYAPDQQAIFEDATTWRDRHRLRPSAADTHRVHLLLIDLQRDFCHPEGALYVGGRSGRGAVEDNDRIARFIYRNLAGLTEVSCTMDTHFPHQIFFPAFWLRPDGRPPAPHQEVTADRVRSGELRPDPALAHWIAGGDVGWLQRQVEFYCDQLERAGKYRLYLWPPHCLLGSIGHSLAGVIHEARLFHSFARAAPARVETKGQTPLSEFYSVLGPEVALRHDGGSLLARDSHFLDVLLRSDRVVIAGQAASHCVKSTIEDLLGRIDPMLTRRVYILRDCMSSVAVPDPARAGEFVFDFTPAAEAALAAFEEAGMHVVDSTTPMAEWPS